MRFAASLCRMVFLLVATTFSDRGSSLSELDSEMPSRSFTRSPSGSRSTSSFSSSEECNDDSESELSLSSSGTFSCTVSSLGGSRMVAAMRQEGDGRKESKRT